MGILSWILVGLVAGAIAKFLLPGRDPGGCFVTVGIGIVGGVIGGFIGNLLGWGGVSGFNPMTLLLATAGAVIFLVLLRQFKKK